MNHPLRLAAALLAVVFAGQAHAQGVIQQLGTPTPGHLGMFVGNGQMMDAGGPSAAGQAPPNSNLVGTRPSGLGVVNSGQGFAQYSGYSNSTPYSEFKWGFDGNGNALITIDKVGGGTAECNLSLNGTVTPCFSTGTGNVNGPGTTTVNHLPLWNNATGTLLNDSGYAFLTPEDYGAKGDGSTNDSDAMQQAINAAKTLKAALWLGPKTYLATDLLINQPMWLRGSGQAVTIIKNPTVGASSNILKIGQTAPTASQVQGVMVSDLALSGNSPNGGWAMSIRHTANTVVKNVYLDQVYCGIEDEQSNSDLFFNISGYTRGTGCAAFKWWTDGTAMADGGRSDQLSLYDVKINNQYGGNDGLVLSGFVQTINAVNVVMLQSNRGLFIDASLNTVDKFPGFGSFYNLQIEGAQTACVWIGGGREWNFTDSYGYSFYGQTGSLGNQGNNDTACLVIRSDATASVTSTIKWNGGSIGGSAHQAIVMQAQGVRISDVGIKSGSYASLGNYPSVELQDLDGLGSADYQFSNVKFCGIYGNAGTYNYGLIRDSGVGQTQIVGGNFNYCTTGEIQDNATDRMIVSASLDRNLVPLPESRRVFVSNTAPTLGADCGAGAAVIGNNLQGQIGIGGAGAVTQCTINFHSTNAANNNGIGGAGPGPVLLQSTTGGVQYRQASASATALTFERSDATNMNNGEIILYGLQQRNY